MGVTVYTKPKKNATAEAEQLSQFQFLTNDELKAYKDASPEERKTIWEPLIKINAEKVDVTFENALAMTAMETSNLPIGKSGISDAQFKEARNAARAQMAEMAIDAVGLGIGLSQAISANKELKGTKEPTFDQRNPDTSQLDNLIADVQKKAGSEMPGRERAREREFDESLALANQTARQFGVQGAGFQQASAVQASKERRAGELDDAQISMGYTQLLGNLLEMKEGIAQNQDLQRERVYKVGVDNYNLKEQALGGQKAYGIQNAYQQGAELARGVTQLPSVLDVFQNSRIAVHRDEVAKTNAEAKVKDTIKNSI